MDVTKTLDAAKTALNRIIEIEKQLLQKNAEHDQAQSLKSVVLCNLDDIHHVERTSLEDRHVAKKAALKAAYQHELHQLSVEMNNLERKQHAQRIDLESRHNIKLESLENEMADLAFEGNQLRDNSAHSILADRRQVELSNEMASGLEAALESEQEAVATSRKAVEDDNG